MQLVGGNWVWVSMRGFSTIGATLPAGARQHSKILVLALIGAFAANPAHAQSGEIIVLRQVDPRNAIVPGTSKNVLTVKTAPDSSYFNLVFGTVRQLSDKDAATVASGRPGNADVDGMIRIALDGAFGPSGASDGARSDHSKSMGGGVVGNSIGFAMGALQNALGTVRNSVPGGK